MKTVGLFPFGLLLTALAGWVDAFSFLMFSGLYTSFMSGNTVQFGIGVATSDASRLLHAASAVLLFVLGSFAGGLLFGTNSRWAFALSVVLHAAALTLAAHLVVDVMPAASLAIAPLAFSMGLQNHIVSKSRADNAGTTFVTGTLFRFGDALARFVIGTDRSSYVVRLFLVVVAFATGAAGATLSTARYGTVTLVISAAVSAACALLALIMETVKTVRKRPSEARAGT